MSKKTSGKPKEKNPRLGVVGGEAVLEGVMMKHKDRYSVAVRKEDGSIAVKNGTYVSKRKKYPVLNIPIVRGVVNMIEMFVLSFRSLTVSAEIYGLEEEAGANKKSTKALMAVVEALSLVLGILLAVALFTFLPAFVTGKLEDLLVRAELLSADGGFGWWKNLIEGILKIVIFVCYLLAVSLMKDIRRTFEYHGAEHKSIFCYEAGEELTPENVKKYRRFHPRCGTSFLFVIIIISILVSSLPFITWDNKFLRMAEKLALLPIVVGLGYEFIMYAGRHDNILVRILSAPGLMMQRITTREPDEKQIECAIYAIKSAMPGEFPDFVCPEWKDDATPDEGKDAGSEDDAEDITVCDVPDAETANERTPNGETDRDA